MPQIARATLSRLKRHTVKCLNLWFKDQQFSYDELFPFDEYIEKTQYSRERKEDLRYVHDHDSINPKMDAEVAGHTKDECYFPEYKAFRGIHSRNDKFKTKVGPFFQKLDAKIFSNKRFIKKVPVNKRAAWLSDKFRWARNFFMSDYSQFEATFEASLMQVELLIYKWFLDKNCRKDDLIKIIREGMMSTNHIKYKDFKFTLNCKRMSGEMNTSGANGIMNLIMSTFVLKEKGNSIDLACAVEGDDGGFEVDFYPTEADYARVGAVVKIDKPEVMNEGSFCGLIYHPEVNDNVTDIRESLLTFGWTTKQYMGASDLKLAALLRSKSLSMLYEYPGCPILKELAMYGLRVTSHVRTDYLKMVMSKSYTNMYERQMMEESLDFNDHPEVLSRPVQMNTRLLVHRKYGIDVVLQHKVEGYLRSLTTLQPLSIPELLPLMPPDCVDYFNRYSVMIPKHELLNFNFNFTQNRRYTIWKDNVSSDLF